MEHRGFAFPRPQHPRGRQARVDLRVGQSEGGQSRCRTPSSPVPSHFAQSRPLYKPAQGTAGDTVVNGRRFIVRLRLGSGAFPRAKHPRGSQAGVDLRPV